MESSARDALRKDKEAKSNKCFGEAVEAGALSAITSGAGLG